MSYWVVIGCIFISFVLYIVSFAMRKTPYRRRANLAFIISMLISLLLFVIWGLLRNLNPPAWFY